MISQYDQLNYADYKPISMQEMWAPAQQLRQQHDQLQEEYAQQEQQGGLSLLGIDPVKDKAAYDIQQNFITKTKEAADQLATKGFIDSGRRRGLMEVKSLYTNQVVPLQNQLKIRQEKADMLYKMKLQNPTYRATMDPNSVSLTDGLKDPNAFNFDGVSGSDLYNSAAKKLEQLSKTINQDVPELKKMPKLSFQYFTAIQSGATPDQAANAMKRDGYDPAVVDKMTNMIHGTIDSTMREFGVYDKFKGNDKAINELWDSTSQAAYNAIGTKQFGQVHDSWGEWNARASQQSQDNQPGAPEILRSFSPSFNRDAIQQLDNLYNASVNTSKSKIVGQGQYAYSEEETSKARNAAQSKINEMAMDLAKRGKMTLPKAGKVPSGELSEWNKRVIDLAKNDSKFVKTTSYAQNANEVVGNVLSKLSTKSGDIKDANGSKIPNFKIESGTKSLIEWDPRTGQVNLSYIPSGEEKARSVSASVDDFGNTMTMQLRDYVKHFSDISKKRKLTPDEAEQYDYYSGAFDNAMNQLANTQQAVYNFQPSK